MMRFGKRGLNLAANAAVTAATKVSCGLITAMSSWLKSKSKTGDLNRIQFVSQINFFPHVMLKCLLTVMSVVTHYHLTAPNPKTFGLKLLRPRKC